MGKNYFDTEALATHPPKAASVRTVTGLPTQHAEQKRRTILPVVAFGALIVALLITTFALGFYIGSEFASQPSDSKQVGQVFEHQLARQAQPAFARIPEELP